MKKNTGVLIFLTIAVTVIVILGVLWLITLTPQEQPEEKNASLVIHGPPVIEVGKEASYTLTLNGRVCINNLTNGIVKWEVSEGILKDNSQVSALVIAPDTGENIILSASMPGIKAEKKIQVYPRPRIYLGMKTWLHSEWYSTEINFSGIANISLALYEECGAEVGPNVWESNGFEEIIIHEYGKYLLVAEGEALSDGRKIRTEKDLIVTPYVQYVKLGSHNLSWENEKLATLSPIEMVAIRLFLEEEIGISVDLSKGSSTKRGNRVNSADYYFYKIDSQPDTVMYQVGFSDQGSARKFYQTSVKDSSGRYLYICWDEKFVSVKRNNPAVSYFIIANDDDGSSSTPPSSGGTSPSPPVSDGPSPSPPI